MMGQRGWFDAWFNSGSKVKIVQFLVEGNDLMLGQKVWFDAGRRKLFDSGSKGMVQC